MTKTYNDALDWAAKWIEDTLRNGPETNERTIEFGTNMAMTLRAAKLDNADLPRATAPSLDAIYSAIESALNTYRMKHTMEAPDLERGLSLVDRLTPDVDKDVARGREELGDLVDYICGSVGDLFRASKAAPRATGETTVEWLPIQTAPRDGSAILLLSAPYELDAGPNGVHQIPAKVAIGHWFAEGTSWVPEGPHPDSDIYLAKTGVWLSGGGWFQPDEVTHWQPLPIPVRAAARTEGEGEKG